MLMRTGGGRLNGDRAKGTCRATTTNLLGLNRTVAEDYEQGMRLLNGPRVMVRVGGVFGVRHGGRRARLP
ncbi:hypothetical protein NL676_019386 [Syzygium grande]|nr:hypothetical protein NL676_019386 [Syzygium grande]